MILWNSSEIDTLCKKNRQIGGVQCTQGIMIFMATKLAIPLKEWIRPYTATIPQNAMLSCSKLNTTLLYFLQSGPKYVIIVQYHSAVTKIDEFLFSKFFHLRSVELHERLVDWDGCIDWMRTNSNCWLIRDKKINLGVCLSCRIHYSSTNTHRSDDWGTKPHKPFAVLILQQCVRTVWPLSFLYFWSFVIIGWMITNPDILLRISSRLFMKNTSLLCYFWKWKRRII